MNVDAVLVLTADDGFRLERARQLLGERVCAVPRMRQRLHRAPPGCGRPYWADDPAFDIRHHVRQVACAAPGDERALLDVAAALIARPLPRSRPLWSATVVTGLDDGGTGLVFGHGGSTRTTTARSRDAARPRSGWRPGRTR